MSGNLDLCVHLETGEATASRRGTALSSQKPEASRTELIAFDCSNCSSPDHEESDEFFSILANWTNVRLAHAFKSQLLVRSSTDGRSSRTLESSREAG